MTLEERIAKRKADGWGVHFIIKQGDNALDADGYLWSRDDGYAWERYLTIDDAKVSLSELDEPHHARIVPVFTRTIKVKRGHSFSWALARMKEGKRVRAGRWDKRCSLRLGDEFFYTFVGCDGQSRKYELLSYDAADTWELAE